MSGMNCTDCRKAITESARGAGLPDSLPRSAERHLETCFGCKAWREGQVRLSGALRAISTDADEVAISADVELALGTEFERVLGKQTALRTARPLRWPVFWTRAAWAGALAATVVLGWVVTRPTQPPVISRNATVPAPLPSAPTPVKGRARSAAPPSGAIRASRVQRPVKTAPVPADEPEQPFVEVPFTLPFAPGERADVVRADVPVSALIAAGFKMHYSDPGASALADVVVGSDGRAHAVRILSISDSSPNRRFQ